MGKRRVYEAHEDVFNDLEHMDKRALLAFRRSFYSNESFEIMHSIDAFCQTRFEAEWNAGEFRFDGEEEMAAKRGFIPVDLVLPYHQQSPPRPKFETFEEIVHKIVKRLEEGGGETCERALEDKSMVREFKSENEEEAIVKRDFTHVDTVPPDHISVPSKAIIKRLQESESETCELSPDFNRVTRSA